MRLSVLASVIFLAAGCEQSDLGTDGTGPKGDSPGDPPPLLTPPGADNWSAESVTCSREEDCAAGETCAGGVCQMKRCVGGDFSSRPPLGKTYAFFHDRELLVADDDDRDGGHFVDRYEPAGAQVTHPAGGSFPIAAGAITDVVGGRFAGEGDWFAASVEATAIVELRSAGEERELAVGFTPRGLGRADLDGDHQDELLAIGDGGKIAVCQVESRECDHWTIGSLAGVDIDGGDVDGDGQDEIVLVQALASDRRRVLVWNPGAEGDEGVPRGLDLDAEMTALAIGDLDRDGVAEIALLADGGYLGIAGDAVHLYGAVSGLAWRQAVAVDGDSVSLAIGDTDASDSAELVVLADHPIADDTITGYAAGEMGFQQTFTGKASVTGEAGHLALADLDGDSPRGTLVDGPTLLAAEAVPTLVVFFPPYDREHSQGVSYVEVGEHNSVSQAVSDTVSLRLGAEIGLEAGVDGIFKAKVAARVDAELSRTRRQETSRSVGSRMFAEPHPDLHGFEYGAVVLSCGCYHGYRYRLRDPKNKLGGDGKQVAVLLPVGGQTTLWSTARYNAMARATGKLPVIPVPTKIGDLASYPARATTLDGKPIPAEDLVFAQPPEYVASDVGSVGFSLAAGSSETNERAMSVGLALDVGFNVEGVTFGASVGVGVGHGYAVSIGEEATFSGGIPAVPDKPGTPEDEYALHAYRFRPVVYRSRYQSADGAEAGFYVVTYEVAK